MCSVNALPSLLRPRDGPFHTHTLATQLFPGPDYGPFLSPEAAGESALRLIPITASFFSSPMLSSPLSFSRGQHRRQRLYQLSTGAQPTMAVAHIPFVYNSEDQAHVPEQAQKVGIVSSIA